LADGVALAAATIMGPVVYADGDAMNRLADEAAYVKALDEIDDLMLAKPGTAAGRRFEELSRMIDEYEAARDGYDLAAIRQSADSS
jgi:hypothetical protein